MFKYKNVSDTTQTLVGEGDFTPRVVAAGAEVVTSVPFSNPNFRYVGAAEAQDSASVTGTQVAQPTAVTHPIQVSETNNNEETN